MKNCRTTNSQSLQSQSQSQTSSLWLLMPPLLGESHEGVSIIAERTDPSEVLGLCARAELKIAFDF